MKHSLNGGVRDGARSAVGKGSAQRRRLSANMEDYLEAIYRLAEADGVSRVLKIAEAVGRLACFVDFLDRRCAGGVKEFRRGLRRNSKGLRQPRGGRNLSGAPAARTWTSRV